MGNKSIDPVFCYGNKRTKTLPEGKRNCNKFYELYYISYLKFDSRHGNEIFLFFMKSKTLWGPALHPTGNNMPRKHIIEY
jgi:hypothetical protein